MIKYHVYTDEWVLIDWVKVARALLLNLAASTKASILLEKRLDTQSSKQKIDVTRRCDSYEGIKPEPFSDNLFCQR